MKKILYIAYFYPPIGGVGLPALQRIRRFLKYLEGYESHVLTMKIDNYPDDYERNKNSSIPTNGEMIYRTGSIDVFGFILNVRSWLKRLIGHNVKNKQTPPDHSMDIPDADLPEGKSSFKNIKDIISILLTYPDFASPWLLPAVMKGVKVVKQNKVDIIFATGMPWTSIIVGCFIKIITGKKLVIDFRDPWVGNPYIQKKRIEGFLDKKWEAMAVNKADLIIANTEALRDEMNLRYPKMKMKIITLPNGYDADDFLNIPKVRLNKQKLMISHAGLLYLKRNPESLIKAIELIRKKNPEFVSHIQFNQIGNINLGYDLKEYCERKGIESSVNFIDQLDHKLCLGYLAVSDILLVIQPGTKTQIPSKLYEYIYLGKPIVAITEKEGALGQLIVNYGFGCVFNPDDHDGIAKYIINMVKEKQNNNLLNEPKCKYKNRELFDARHIASTLYGHLSGLV